MRRVNWAFSHIALDLLNIGEDFKRYSKALSNPNAVLVQLASGVGVVITLSSPRPRLVARRPSTKRGRRECVLRNAKETQNRCQEKRQKRVRSSKGERKMSEK